MRAQLGGRLLNQQDYVLDGEELGLLRSSDLAACEEPGLDLPLHGQALKRLSLAERACFRKAISLLSAGGGIPALLREGDLRLGGLGVYEALLTHSWVIRFQDSAEMIRLAQLAVELAQGLDEGAEGRDRVTDLQARAWAELANAHRVADQLRSADRSLGQAYALLEQGSGDLYLKARLFDIDASLMGTWREFSLAEDRLSLVSELYLELGERHLAGRALVSRALYTSYSWRPEESLRLNEQALDLLERQRDPALFLLAMHNDLLFRVDLGLYEEAKKRLFKSRRYFIYQDRINALKRRGIEGRIEYGLGNLTSAELAFREERDGMVEAGMTFHAAIVSLELATVLLSEGKSAEAEKEVITARNIFASVAVYREFLGSVIFLEELFHRKTVTPKVIEKTVSQLWRKEFQIGSRHFR